jgi:hypothetical protein
MQNAFNRLRSAVTMGSTTLVLGTVALAQPALAATSACTPQISGFVTNVGSCEVSDTASQDFLNTNPMTVNAEEFFSFDDWIFAEKIGGDESIDIGARGDGEGQSGSWSIASDAFSNWSDIMMVFKSGNRTFLTGYQLDGQTSGTWQSPFLQDRGGPKDVSHISFYVRGSGDDDSTGVPEPGMMIGLGAVAFGLVRKRMQDNA